MAEAACKVVLTCSRVQPWHFHLVISLQDLVLHLLLNCLTYSRTNHVEGYEMVLQDCS